MNILIDQVGFVNKGAELMLCSVVNRIQKEYPNARILIQLYEMQLGGHEYCQEHNIKAVRTGLKVKILSFFENFLLKLNILKCKSRFFHVSDIDVILDAGGFRFGDQWHFNRKKYLDTKRYYRSFNRNCKLVLLPQSFGPFEDKYSKMAMNYMQKRADLIFSREHISSEYLSKLPKNYGNIQFMRDFTMDCKYNTFISKLLENKDYIIFIVNKKMVTHSSLSSNKYLDFICKLVEDLHQKGENIYLLNHEGLGDKDLCNEINSRLNLELPVISDLRAMHVKNVIGNAKLVVSSRYHGVVSGITQKIPTFSTSWSHKYDELLSTYNLSSNLLDINDPDLSIAKLHDAITNPDKYVTTDKILQQEKDSIEKMWAEVFKFIS